MIPSERSRNRTAIPDHPGARLDSHHRSPATPEADAPAPTGFTGPTSIPQIVVGAPSPSVRPAPTATQYRSVAFRPDTTLDGWSTDTMTMRGVSQRGHLHRHNGAPRQDDFAVHHLPDGRVIVAVADGVSQSPQSHLGASIVIKQAAEWIRTNLGPDTADLDWSALISNTAYALTVAAQTLFGLDEPDPVRALQELATTLVCAVIEPVGPGVLRAHLVAVGDSSAWVLTAGEFIEVLGGKTTLDGGLASSAVTALPCVPTHLAPTVFEFQDNAVLLIGTDGIGDPLGAGQGSVGDLLRDVLARPHPPSLIEFAYAVDFSRETFDDDRTLVAVWPKGIDSTHIPEPQPVVKRRRTTSSAGRPIAAIAPTPPAPANAQSPTPSTPKTAWVIAALGVVLLFVLIMLAISYIGGSSQPTRDAGSSPSSATTMRTPVSVFPTRTTTSSAAPAAPSTVPPTISGTDAHGFTDAVGPRCNDPDSAVAIARTAHSRVVICQTDNGRLYYQGLQHGRPITTDKTVRTPDGFIATNEDESYRLSAHSLTIMRGSLLLSNEPVLESHGSQ